MSLPAGDPGLLTQLAGELRSEAGRKIALPELGARRIEALVWMAAQHPDEAEGAAALTDVLRLATALDDEAGEAASTLRDILRRVPGALARLDRARRGAQVQAAFQQKMAGRALARAAARHDAPPASAGTSVAQLRPDLPRLDAAEARARRGR